MRHADTLIVGGSVAGVRCARALRAASYPGSIVLADAEPGVPYDKPPLTKSFLDPGSPLPVLVEPQTLAAAGIEHVTGRAARALDTDSRLVHFDDGEDIEFDHLVIATGARPRSLPGLIGAGPPIVAIRSAASAEVLRDALRPGATVAVIGGGFLGLEVAASAQRLGVRAHVVDVAEQVLARGVAAPAAAAVERLHRERGTIMHLGCRISTVDAGGHGAVLELTDGTVLDVDAVVVAVGAVPATDWLQGSSLTVEDGVVCDAGLQTAPGVYAVGDCARWHNARYGVAMRLEHWTAAGEQAAFVARRIASGESGECAIVPYVWSVQFEHRLQLVGMCGETTQEMQTRAGARVFVECDAADRVVGVAAVDQPRVTLAVRRALVGGAAPLDTLFPIDDYERIG